MVKSFIRLNGLLILYRLFSVVVGEYLARRSWEEFITNLCYYFIQYFAMTGKVILLLPVVVTFFFPQKESNQRKTPGCTLCYERVVVLLWFVVAAQADAGL